MGPHDVLLFFLDPGHKNGARVRRATGFFSSLSIAPSVNACSTFVEDVAARR